MGFRIPRAVFRIPKSRILDFDSPKEKFPGFRYSSGEYIDEIMLTVIKKLCE